MSAPADSQAVAFAAELQARTGGRWLGWWGPWSRKLWAVYCGPTPRPVCVAADDPDGLARAMSEAEAETRLQLEAR